MRNGFLCLVGIFFALAGESQCTSFKSFTPSTGLFQTDIIDTGQGKKTNRWIAVKGGISLYHGSKLINYDDRGRLQSHNIEILLCNHAGIRVKMSADHFSNKAFDTQPHDRVIIENPKYGNMLAAEINVNQEVFV